MTSSTSFFGILLFVIMAKGVLAFNEPFLVAICFVAFIYTVYTRLGNDIYNSFNARYESMVNEDREYIRKYRVLLKELVDLYKARISLFRRLHRMGKFFKAQTQRYIELREAELRNQVNENITSQLELLNQKETTFRLQFQQELVSKFINTLKVQATQNKTSVITQLVPPVTINQLEQLINTYK